MKSMNILKIFLHPIKSVAIALLARLGLLNLSGQGVQEEEEEESRPNYLLDIEGVPPFVVPVPLQVLTAHIKQRLPVVELGQLQQGADNCQSFCSICLEILEGSHEVKELLNCDHVFHRECLDNWVDEGQVTCPLCRSMLFPAKDGRELLMQIRRGN